MSSLSSRLLLRHTWKRVRAREAAACLSSTSDAAVPFRRAVLVPCAGRSRILLASESSFLVDTECSRVQGLHQVVRHFSAPASPAQEEEIVSTTAATSTTTTSTPSSASSNSEKKASSRSRSGLSKADEHHEETKRKRLSDVLVSEVLQAKHSYRWVDPVIARNATLQRAIQTAIEGGLSGMMVLDEEGDRNHVVGLVTSRDLLRIIAAGFSEGESADAIVNRKVGDYMTPISQVIFARPEESVGMCRTIMAKLGIKCLPVLSKEGRVEGLMTARDMSDFGLSAKEKGGKKAYLDDISERVGLSSDTSMAEPPTYMKAHLALEQKPLFINVGQAGLPHPFKTETGIGRNMNDLMSSPNGADVDDSLFLDDDLSEDSNFVTTVNLPDEQEKTPRTFTYFGVADGVGSWREYGVDPREFSRRLMEECENVLHEASRDGREDGRSFRQVIAPAQVMAQAYERVKADNVIGSSTACIALFDGIRHQLHFSNLGDCGVIVLRHIDSDVAGTLKRERIVPRSERVSDLRVAFVSQQQLRSFNHPYQLGWTGDEIKDGEHSSFKPPGDSCTSSLHLRRGDIVIMATDGLFDNVELDDICSMALEWEQKHGFIRGGDIGARERRWSMGNSLTGVSAETIHELAQTLCRQARENSLDSSIDSPFAILAKENDIMWSGGMPDDCTVIALHVVGRDSNDIMDATNM